MLIHLDKDDAVIGVISDTHGLFRTEISEIFRGVDYIIHAGDVGGKWVLQKLQMIAPVLTVKGNTDDSVSIPDLPESAILETNSSRIYLLHDICKLNIDPVSTGCNGVIYGHSHSYLINWKKDFLYFNPGSAGPHRFNLTASVGILKVRGGLLEPEIVELK